MKRWIVRISALCFLCIGVVAASCSRFDAANLGIGSFDGHVDQGLIFDVTTKQALDIYRPAQPGPHPVIVFWYGGSWQSGARADYRFVGVELARRGFTTVIPDYRKYPFARYPSFVQDAAAALAWVRSNIADHGGDSDRIVISGHSAGAHTAVMLASDQRYLAKHGLTPRFVKGVIGVSGPYHYTPESPTLVKVFSGPENFPAMQAGNFIDGDEPPMALMHGAEDLVVGRVNIERVGAALDRVGGCYRTRFYPDVGHVGMIGAFTWAYETEPIVSDFVENARLLLDGTLCGPQQG